MQARLLWLVLLPVLAPGAPDLIPPGHHSVRSELVFVDGEALRGTRICAAPIRGLHGVAAIEPGVPFRFSSKYGTRIYALPAGEPMPEEFDRARFAQWPSSWPPVGEVRSAPMTRSVAVVRTTCRLVEVGDGGPVIEVVERQTFDANGNPVDERTLLVVLWTVAAAGLAGLIALGRRAEAQ